MPLRIVFCGTPAFAVPALRQLIAQPDFQIAGVITQPDRPRGRGGEISVSPVKKVALEAGLPVYQPERIKEEAAQEYFRNVAPDVVAIIAYGQIILARLIAIPRLGWRKAALFCINHRRLGLDGSRRTSRTSFHSRAA